MNVYWRYRVTNKPTQIWHENTMVKSSVFSIHVQYLFFTAVGWLETSQFRLITLQYFYSLLWMVMAWLRESLIYFNSDIFNNTPYRFASWSLHVHWRYCTRILAAFTLRQLLPVLIQHCPSLPFLSAQYFPMPLLQISKCSMPNYASTGISKHSKFLRFCGHSDSGWW